MLYDLQLEFSEFKEATAFLRWVKCGVVRPQSVGTGYVWDSEGLPLNEKQKLRYEAYIGLNSVWYDGNSGLTWMDSAAYVSLYGTSGMGKIELGLPFAGFSDWRWPTLTELKTLRSSLPDKNGLWRIRALEGKIGGVLRSATNGSHWTVSADWDFSRDCSCEDRDSDSKIVWNSEGQYAGVEGGWSRPTGAVNILVRGVDSSKRPSWLQAQIEWSEKNRFDDFPVTEQTVDNLRTLRVSKNNYPPHVDRLASLNSFYADDCTFLDPGVYSLGQLELLSWKMPFSCREVNQPGVLSSEIGKLKRLRNISVTGCMEAVPDAICDLENLEEFKLNCNVSALPAELGKLLRLRKLVIRSPLLSALPYSIENLSELIELAVHAKGIQSFLDELIRVRSLVSLDLSECSIKNIPDELKGLNRLERLKLSYNPLANLSPGLIALGNLKSLDLSYTNLISLPLELVALRNLECLSLRCTPIVKVPDALREMSSLVVLDLSGTQIEEIPDWIWEMKSLRRLVLAKTWKLPRVKNLSHPTIKIEYHVYELNQPLGIEWLQKMGMPKALLHKL